MVMQIAVIGAGIIGLTTVSRLLDEFYPNVAITVYANVFTPDTTSDVSAGYWEPYCIGDSPKEKENILKWGKETYDVMMRTALSKDASKCGVQAISAYVLQEYDQVQIPYWSEIVSQFRVIDRKEIESICELNHENSKIKHGYHFRTTTVTVTKYLSILQKELMNKGVKFVRLKLENIEQLIKIEDRVLDYIINCSGIGARNLVNDLNVFPTRGQVLRVKAPWIKHCLMIEGQQITYVLPLCELAVIGGTQEKENYSTDINEEDCKKIMDRCSSFIPSLKEAEIVTKTAGLRPSRKSGVRLELELVRINNKSVKIVHNYGHGGSGVTISWGCASNVLELVKNDQLKISKI